MFPLTMPRVLEYKNDVLYQKPLKEVENLRGEKIVDVKNVIKNKYELELDSRNTEIKLNLNLEENNFVDLKFRFNNEYISITYDKSSEVCTIDRSNMELGGRGIRKFKLKADKSLDMHMFIDNSVMEIYYEDGLETTTFMYFPKSDDFKIEIQNDNNVNINELCVWNLRGVRYE